jgi:hemolysin activation/secretion protein
VSGGAYGDWRDEFGGSSVSAFSVNIEAGELSIESRALARIDAATSRAAGAYQKLSYSLLRLQPLRGPLSLSVSMNGQFALQNLDSAEKMWLGGASAVRAYPQGEAAGDDGYLANVELRWQLAPVAGLRPVLLAFVDTGGVRPDHDRFQPGDAWRFLSGTGLGVNVAERHGFQLSAAWAWQLGPEDAQADKDRSGRGWILIGKTF